MVLPGRTSSADEIAAEIVHALVDDLAAKAGREVLLMVNGFGGTPMLELYLMYDAANRQLAQTRQDEP